ncbi:MAG TPA: class I SAM-dependent methyltransferase [Bryobacteraceae bacterium]|jgi:SAM-dependent methyltransferase|nr:class I SAM-dependent methyltransferase [Bryobacteraceae bacterium]
MASCPQPKQSDHSVAKNASFFGDQRNGYKSKISTLDTYRNISASINAELNGVHHLLDVGNGGTFDYDVSLLPELAAVDLFLEDLPPGSFPTNVVPKNGSALALPFAGASFDGVIMVMLIHHLIGNSVSECWENVTRAVDEAFRVLKPGGKLIVMESCVPQWFYGFEKLVFPLAAKLIGRLSSHPATLQFPPAMIADLLRKHAANVDVLRIPKGRWVLQYGIQYPSALTPVAPYRFVTYKG